MIRLPTDRRLLALASAGYALAAFLWIGIEDQSLVYVSLLGAGAAGLGTAHSVWRRLAGRQVSARQAAGGGAIAGLVIGLAAAPLTALLMAIKVSLHSHAVPDFSADSVRAVLARAPIWGLAGGIGGLALARLVVGLGQARDGDAG